MTRPSWQAAAALVAAILLGAATIGAARADGPAAKGNPRQAVEALLGMVRQLPAEARAAGQPSRRDHQGGRQDHHRLA